MKETHQYFRQLQQEISDVIQQFEGQNLSISDWDYFAGGGGQTRMLRNGLNFKEATINSRAITGKIPITQKAMPVLQTTFFSTGIDVLIKPNQVFAPRLYCHFHYVQLTNSFHEIQDSWFTTHIAVQSNCPRAEDTNHIRQLLEQTSVPLKNYTPAAPLLGHSVPMFSLGGLEMDLRNDFETDFKCIKALGQIILPMYLPILEHRLDIPNSVSRVQQGLKLPILNRSQARGNTNLLMAL
jgi:coproporphyrinogen III oxidase